MIYALEVINVLNVLNSKRQREKHHNMPKKTKALPLICCPKMPLPKLNISIKNNKFPPLPFHLEKAKNIFYAFLQSFSPWKTATSL